MLFTHAWGTVSPPLNTLDKASLETLVEQEPDNLEAHYQLGIRYHHAAEVDCEESLERALKHFEYVYTNDSSRQDARAFYGSATVLKAKYAGILSKLKYAREGFAILDETAQNAPDNFKVRLVRAANSANCPAFLGRGDIAQKDLDWLMRTIDTRPQDISEESIKIARFYAGYFAMKNNDSRCLTLLEQSLNMNCITSLDSKIEQTYQRAKKKFAKTKAKRSPSHRSFK